MRRNHSAAVFLAALCAGTAIVAWKGPGGAGIPAKPLVTGKYITPIGKHVPVGSYPCNMVPSPDGTLIAVGNVGFRQNLSILSPETGRVLSQVTLDAKEVGDDGPDGLYYGLAWGRKTDDGWILHASRGAQDFVASYLVTFDGQISDEIDRWKNPAPENPAKIPHNIAGIAVSGDGEWIYAANNQTHAAEDHRGSMSVLNKDGIVKRIETGGFPYAVAALTKGKDADRKVYVSSERDGVVSLVDPVAGKRLANIPTGASPISLLLNKAQSRLFVANAGSDTVSVIDTSSDKVLKTILVRPDDLRGLPGATPNGLALNPSEDTLFVTLADMNAVAVVDARTYRLRGYLPAGWYPTSCVVSPDGNRLLVASAKGVSERNPNDKPVGGLGQYGPNIIEGTVSMIDLKAAAAQLRRHTAQVVLNNRIVKGIDSRRHPTFKNPGIKYVVYVIKENRTYDQVLGDMPRGNGDPSICMFPRDVTPNQHALASRFVLMDSFYCCAEVSADGWNWSTSGMANEYVSRNSMYSYSGRGRDYDFEGQNNGTVVDMKGLPDVARAPGGYIWDLCKKHGVSYRNYGFFVSGTDALGTSIESAPKTYPTKKALDGHTNVNFRQYDLAYADSEAWIKHKITPPQSQLTKYGRFDSPSRFSEWKREFDQFVKAKKMPRFQMVRLPRDHTAGTRAATYSPRAMVADNDYAVGQLVEAISHSPFWKETAIFILEDDAQAGYDHIDSHRSTAYVVSPYVKRGLLYSRFANTDSMLRTMELLLGLPPMNQYDAVAPPLMVFGSKPSNREPFRAILPYKHIVGEINQPTAYRSADSARLINRFQEESLPDIELNDILWGSIMGATTPRPPVVNSIRTEPEDDD